jgi:ubiquinone/menaquinone biosynthesis C-methylase UbiE
MPPPRWLLEIIRCPQTGEQLRLEGDSFVRLDGTSYPVIGGIPSLLFPTSPLGSDARWQRAYDWFAPFYDLNERIFARVLAGVDMRQERTRVISLLGLEKGMRILEVSPGPCVYQPDIRAAVGADAEFCSVDLSLGMLRQCQKRNRNLNIALVQANGSYLPFADESFDALFHFGGVNLFDDPERALTEFVRIVRKRGIVSWGDEGFSPSVPDGWKKRFLLRMNPGYAKERLPMPKGLTSVRELEVCGGFAYLVVANKWTE